MNIEKMTCEELSSCLQQETVSTKQLDFENDIHKQAFYVAVRRRPALLAMASGKDANNFVAYALKENPELLIYLPRDRWTDEWLIWYLSYRFQKTGMDTNVTCQSSFDDKLILTYQAASQSDLCYHDYELGIPIAMRCFIYASFKLLNPFVFLQGVDLGIESVGANALNALMTNTIETIVRAELLSYIKEKKIGYYSLCESTKEVEERIEKALVAAFNNYGISVVRFTIKQMAIPKSMQTKIENLLFEIRQRRINVEAETEFAAVSLKNYQSKLEIQEKNPNAEHGLTEYEKDLALKRYLIKMGRMPKEYIDRSIDFVDVMEETDATLQQAEDKKPIAPTKKKPWSARKKFLFWTIFGAAVSTIIMMSNFGVGMIALGIVTGISGTVAAFNHKTIFGKPSQQVEGPKEDELNQEEGGNE